MHATMRPGVYTHMRDTEINPTNPIPYVPQIQHAINGMNDVQVKIARSTTASGRYLVDIHVLSHYMHSW